MREAKKMSVPMQLAVCLSYGTFMLAWAWRFNRSTWANMRVVDLMGHPSVEAFVRREMAKNAEQRRQWDELMALYQRDVERLQVRLDLDRRMGLGTARVGVGYTPHKEKQGK